MNSFCVKLEYQKQTTRDIVNQLGKPAQLKCSSRTEVGTHKRTALLCNPWPQPGLPIWWIRQNTPLGITTARLLVAFYSIPPTSDLYAVSKFPVPSFDHIAVASRFVLTVASVIFAKVENFNNCRLVAILFTHMKHMTRFQRVMMHLPNQENETKPFQTPGQHKQQVFLYSNDDQRLHSFCMSET